MPERRALSKAALMQFILDELRQRTGAGLAAIDVRLSLRPGEVPNWDIAVAEVGATDVASVREALSRYDWTGKD